MNEDWRKKSRSAEGSIKTIKGYLYARIQWIDETTGKRKEKLRRAENRTKARTHIKDMIAELENHGEETLNADKMTFSELATKYEKTELVAAIYRDGRKAEGKRSIVPQKSLLKPIVEHFGRKPIRKIKASDLKAYKVERLNTPVVVEVNNKILNDEETKKKTRRKYRIEKVKKERPRKVATVNRELALLRVVLNFAKNNRWLIENPFERQKGLISASAEVQRDRILSHEEEGRLLAACNGKREHLKPLVIAAVDTGMRRGELFKLQWKEIDLFTRKITVLATNTKTQKSRIIGMTQRVYDELSKLWEISPKVENDLVFGISNNVKRSFVSACNDAGLIDFHFHDLRHCFCTRAIRAGVPHLEVMKLSGHQEIKTFQRYLNLNTESISNSANMLDAYLTLEQSKIERIEASNAVN